MNRLEIKNKPGEDIIGFIMKILADEQKTAQITNVSKNLYKIEFTDDNKKAITFELSIVGKEETVKVKPKTKTKITKTKKKLV